MHLQNVFVNIIGIEYLTQDNESLEKFCREEIAKEKQRIDLEQSLFFDITNPTVTPLVSEIEELINLVYLSVGMSDKYKPKVFRGWANLNTPHIIVEPHCHPESYFSAVYYVKADKDECAPLQFISPIQQHQFVIQKQHIATNNEFNSSRWSIPPETGKLLIFPSWLMHYVNGECKTDRVSMAFDTKLVETNNG
jgi:uncharacterized protein (TIGR02466 family)